MHYWTARNPCLNCGATSNTSHDQSCRNANMYDSHGRAIPAVKLNVNSNDKDDS